MRRHNLPLAGFAAFLLVLPATELPASEPQVEMHRQLVDEAEADGTYPARSTKGSFSVVSPVPFSDYTLTADDSQIGRMVMHFVAGRSLDGYEFAAIETEWTERMNQPDFQAIVAEMAEGQGAPVPEVEIRRAGDEEFVRAELIGSTHGVLMRVSRTPQSVFNVLCEFPLEKGRKGREACSEFLDSFKLER